MHAFCMPGAERGASEVGPNERAAAGIANCRLQSISIAEQARLTKQQNSVSWNAVVCMWVPNAATHLLVIPGLPKAT